MDGQYTYEYLPRRGISKETFRYYNVLTKCGHNGEPISVGFPWPNGALLIKSTTEKDFKWEGEVKPEPGLFGLDCFASSSNKAIVITEGAEDALSVWEVAKTPAVSVRSSGSAVSDVGAVRSELNAYERIYLAFDNDAPGRSATEAVARMFEYGKIYHVRFSNRKDANEYLQHGEGDTLLNLIRNARPYVPDNIISTFEDFRKALSVPHRQGIPYPFPTLTKMTYGLRTGETVLIKAPEKVGKTALMHAIEANLLEKTDDNVGALFIEEPEHRHLQYLAGLELKAPAHLPDSGYTEAQIGDAVERLVKREERLHLYRHFGSDDPRLVLDTVRFLVAARACRWVLFDHISMVSSGLSTDEERRHLEFLSTRLEMMVKELDFGLIMVSHVNDYGQTRGSHWLTKVADIVIDAQRDTMAVDDQEKRTIHLSIPFNRFCHMTGPAGSIVFDPNTYTLAETYDDGHTLGLQQAA